MKTLKILFTMLVLSMVTACTDFVPPREQPDHSHERDLLKRRLTGEWVVSGEKDSYIYAFMDGDTIYTKTREGNIIDLWTYQAITGDSIRIVRSYWTTDNRVIFYSNDSIRIEDFIPGDAAVYPPLFGDAVLIRFIAMPPAEEEPVLTVADFDVPAGCIMNCANMQHDSVYVINSEEEWANIFTCGDRPEIDFSTKTLLVAFGGTTNGVSNISKELLFEDNLLYLMVDIELNMYAVAQGWHVILITDKISTQSVILNLNKHFGTDDTLPACTTRTDDAVHYLTDYHTTILKEYSQDRSLSSHIVIAKLFDDTEPTAYLTVEHFSTYRICNYPQYAKEWDIPENGLSVLLSGKVYPPSYDPGFHPDNRAFFDLELTVLKSELP